MARPKKNGLRDIELADTIKWCGLIKIVSKLSDLEIEKKLGMAEPSGQNFNRWRRGKRSLSLNEIQFMVANARKSGLLPVHYEKLRGNPLYERALCHMPGPNRPSNANAREVWIAKTNALAGLTNCAKKYADAKRALLRAADVAAKHGAEFFMLIEECPGDPAGDPFDFLKADQVLEAVGYLLEGEAIDFWPNES